MTTTHTRLNLRNTGEQVDTSARQRRLLPHTRPRPIPTVSPPARYSITWFARLALLCGGGSAVVGFALAF